MSTRPLGSSGLLKIPLAGRRRRGCEPVESERVVVVGRRRGCLVERYTSVVPKTGGRRRP